MENKHTLYIKLSHLKKKKCYIGTNSKNKTDNILVNIFISFLAKIFPIWIGIIKQIRIFGLVDNLLVGVDWLKSIGRTSSFCYSNWLKRGYVTYVSLLTLKSRVCA